MVETGHIHADDVQVRVADDVNSSLALNLQRIVQSEHFQFLVTNGQFTGLTVEGNSVVPVDGDGVVFVTEGQRLQMAVLVFAGEGEVAVGGVLGEHVATLAGEG